MVPQRERFQSVINERREELHSELASTPTLLTTLIDNEFTIGSRWLSALPYDEYTTITSHEISCGLSRRTLVTGLTPVCRLCSKSNDLGHDEVCRQRQVLRTIRHESVKKTLKYHIGIVPMTEVETEPRLAINGRVTSESRRPDLRIIGRGSYSTTTSDYDVTVHSLFAQTVVSVRGRGNSVEEFIANCLKKEEEVKRRRYSHLVPGSFHPIVMTSNGTLSPDTLKVFKFWKKKLGRITYSSLIMHIGIGLLRYAARNFDY